MKKRCLFGLLAMLLAAALMLSGCDLFNLTDDDGSQTTYDPIIIDGKDAQNNDIRVKFTKAVSAVSASVKAAAAWTPVSNDNYEISKGNTVVSSGTITLVGSAITFNATSGSGGTGTYNGGQDLAFTIPGVIDDFYKPGVTKVKTPVASSPKASDKTDPDDKITLKCDTSGAVIRFTVDGTAPNSASSEYTSETEIKVKYEDGKPFTVKAIATKGNMAHSELWTQTYSRRVEKPTAKAPSPPTQGSIITLSSATDDVEFRWTYTNNDATPTAPTYSPSEGLDGSVMRGVGDTIIIDYGSGSTFKIMVMAISKDYVNSEVLDTSFSKGSGGNLGGSGTNDQFGADNNAVKVDEDKKTIDISGTVRATSNIVVKDGYLLTIEKPNTNVTPNTKPTLTVDANRTITVTGSGKYKAENADGVLIDQPARPSEFVVKGGATLKLDGNIFVTNGGKLTIVGESNSYPILEGNGTITVQDGGIVYISVPGSGKLQLDKTTGKIVVQTGGELIVVDNGENHPLIGKVNTKDYWNAKQGYNLKEVGADFIVGSNSSITLLPASAIAMDMSLSGTATVFGVVNLDPDATVADKKVRNVVSLTNTFTVLPGATLTIGMDDTKDSRQTELNIKTTSSVNGQLRNLGEIRVKKASKIESSSSSAVIGVVKDSNGVNTITVEESGSNNNSKTYTWWGDKTIRQPPATPAAP